MVNAASVNRRGSHGEPTHHPHQMPDRHFVLIVNDKAGTATTRSKLEALRTANPRFGNASTVAPFAGIQDVTKALADHPNHVPVAVGGDGTVSLVARVNRERDAPHPLMGVIPMGTGNLLAHELGIPSPEAAIPALLDGATRSLDLMTTTRDDFPVALMSISCGFEADFIRSYDKWRGSFGRPVGAAAGALRLLGLPARRALVEVDGTPIVTPTKRYWNAGLYLMSAFAFGVKTFPDAISDDGLFEAVFHAGRLRYLAGLKGRRYPEGPPDPRYRRGRKAHFEVPGAVQIDGETVPGGTFDVEVEQRGLTMLIPPGSAR
ncbi:MAG: diacylglycerol/lipid kinase family protein [Longimicrobiales bacterium]